MVLLRSLNGLGRLLIGSAYLRTRVSTRSSTSLRLNRWWERCLRLHPCRSLSLRRGSLSWRRRRYWRLVTINLAVWKCSCSGWVYLLTSHRGVWGGASLNSTRSYSLRTSCVSLGGVLIQCNKCTSANVRRRVEEAQSRVLERLRKLAQTHEQMEWRGNE